MKGRRIRNRTLRKFKRRFKDKKTPGLEETIVKLLQEKEYLNILEIGCGLGYLLLDIEKKYKEKVNCYGINRKTWKKFSEPSQIRQISIDSGLFSDDDLAHISFPDIRFINLDKEPIPFDDNFFDLIISQTSFHYIEDKIALLIECSRVLSNTGYMFIHLDTYNLMGNNSKIPRLVIKKENLEIDSIKYFTDLKFKIIERKKSDNIGTISIIYEQALNGKLHSTLRFIKSEFKNQSSEELNWGKVSYYKL